MAVLATCCWCHSVRKGSFLSAIYTLAYFIIFSGLTTLTWISEDWESDRAGLNESTTSMTSQADTSHSFSFESSGTRPFVWCMAVVDTVCEVAGIFVSIVLICGLKQERKSFLIPWMVVVPLHTLTDTCSVIYIIIEHCAKSVTHHELSSTVYTFIYILVDMLLNTLNTYVFLCVVSQYQEYNDGRGTAAYEGLFSQRNSESVNYMNPMRDLHSMNSLIRSPNQRRTSQKSDTWNDDSCVNTTDVTPVQGRSHNKQSARRESNDKNHGVRFGSITCEDPDNSGKSFLKPGAYNARSSLSDKSAQSSSGLEESTAESVGEL